MLTEDDIARQIVCGPDPAPHIEKFQRFAEAGYTHVSVHQVTPNQEDFFRFYENEILPELSRMGLTVAADRAAVARCYRVLLKGKRVMKVRGYVKGDSYFCLEQHKKGSDDEPLEEVPLNATCTECQRLLHEVAEDYELDQQR
jgi:hypothetical protein